MANLQRQQDYSFNARAVWQGIWGALTPLPIVFQGQELSLMFLFGGVIVFLSGIIGATQLFHHFKLARLSGIFFLCGSFAISLPLLLDNPFATLLASIIFIHFVFVLHDLRLNLMQSTESCDRFRALGGGIGTLLLIIFTLFIHLAGAVWFQLGIALSTVISLTLFHRWVKQTTWANKYCWAVHVGRIGIMLLLFVHASTFIAFGIALFIVGISGLLNNRQERRDWWWDFLLTHPAWVMFLTFFLLAFCGTLLLLLPGISRISGSISVIDAAFTSVSAVCVTGLTVLDTGRDFTLVGQLAILLLIQLGGLGIMSIATVALGIIGRRLTLHQEYLMSSITDIEQHNLFDALLLVFRFTFSVEAIGAVVLTVLFLSEGVPFDKALFEGCFTAVSGFCNAGFSLQSNNLIAYQNSPAILATVGILIVLGGLAPATSLLIPAWLQGRTIPAAARITLLTTVILILIGSLLILLFEWNGALAGLNIVGKFSNAVFQSVTLRTAGFNSIDLVGIAAPTVIVMVLLMFIGGSPGSTAGGIKTTTVAVLAVAFWANITNHSEVIVFNRKISNKIVFRAMTIAIAAFLLLLVTSMMLVITQSASAGKLIFEAASALGTVGLTIGATAELDAMGKVIVMLAMFAGRIGPVTLFMLLNDGSTCRHLHRPDAKITLN